MVTVSQRSAMNRAMPFSVPAQITGGPLRAGVPHPRNFGTFPRVLGRYVRELKVIPLEEAVRKMAAFPAARIGLADRGVLREGLKADIAVFDPETVGDRAGFGIVEIDHRLARGAEEAARQATRVMKATGTGLASGKRMVPLPL